MCSAPPLFLQFMNPRMVSGLKVKESAAVSGTACTHTTVTEVIITSHKCDEVYWILCQFKAHFFSSQTCSIHDKYLMWLCEQAIWLEHWKSIKSKGLGAHVDHVRRCSGTRWPSTYLVMVCVSAWTLLGRFQGSCLTWRRNFLVQLTRGSISCWNSDRNTNIHGKLAWVYHSYMTACTLYQLWGTLCIKRLPVNEKNRIKKWSVLPLKQFKTHKALTKKNILPRSVCLTSSFSLSLSSRTISLNLPRENYRSLMSRSNTSFLLINFKLPPSNLFITSPRQYWKMSIKACQSDATPVKKIIQKDL